MLIWKNQLTAFLITFYRPQIEDQCKDQQGSQLRQQFGKSAATEIDGTHYLYKIAQRIDTRNPLRPLRHTVIGVKRPLIRIRISMKNHMTNMACCNVVE